MAQRSIVELIQLKRDGKILDTEAIRDFVRGVTDGSWADYQISAMLMAMFLRGLDAAETAELALAMAASGDQFDLSGIPGIKVDKHSTGGVADTTTLILTPLVAACGAPVVKISGRGLGFTGGTIDKLQSIPGFRVDLSQSEAIAQVKRIGLAILSQTDNLTPADKKLYALRDVTATIDHIPLIATSIMSKKIASGADAIVLDVKCGSGAFMQDIDSARQLAKTMVDIGQMVGRQVMAVISSMDQPLGMNIGNSLEVIEALEILKGHVRGDLLDVSLTLGSHMLVFAGLATQVETARQMLQDALDTGAGLAKMREMIIAQGGNPASMDDYGLFPQPACRLSVKAPRSGFITAMRTAEIGKAFVEAGGGRLQKSDSIDYAAGIILKKRINQPFAAGDELAEIHAATPEKAQAAADRFLSALTLEDHTGPRPPVILGVVTASSDRACFADSDMAQ